MSKVTLDDLKIFWKTCERGRFVNLKNYLYWGMSNDGCFLIMMDVVFLDYDDSIFNDKF